MRPRKVDVSSNNQHRILLIILYVATLTSYACAGTIQSTPSPILPMSTQTPSSKPTATITSTPDDVATANFMETESINTIISTVQPVVLVSYPSTDGKWRVEVIRYDCINYASEQSIAYEQLKLIDLPE